MSVEHLHSFFDGCEILKMGKVDFHTTVAICCAKLRNNIVWRYMCYRNARLWQGLRKECGHLNYDLVLDSGTD